MIKTGSGGERRIILASFPRSGNTWVRFIIANVYNKLFKCFDEIDFYNIHEIVPELGLKIKPYYDRFPKVFKTHEPFRTSFSRVVLMIRNPCDSLYSYYHYLNGERGLKLSLDEVVRHEEYGVQALVRHTHSYVNHCSHLLIIRYENLTYNPQAEMMRLLTFIGVDASEEIIKYAVEMTAFNKMKKYEQTKGRKYGRKDYKFIRKGLVGEGEKQIMKNNELYRFILKELENASSLNVY